MSGLPVEQLNVCVGLSQNKILSQKNIPTLIYRSLQYISIPKLLVLEYLDFSTWKKKTYQGASGSHSEYQVVLSHGDQLLAKL